MRPAPATGRVAGLTYAAPMQAELSERVRAAIEALNRGQVETVLDTCRDDVELKRVEGTPEEGRIRGKDALRAFLAPDAFDSQTIEPLEMAEGEDVVVAHIRVRNRGAASGIEMEVESYVVYRFEDGAVGSIENWRDRADAERSAGISL